MPCELSSTLITVTMFATLIPSIGLAFYVIDKLEKRARKKHSLLIADAHKRETSNAAGTMIGMLAGMACWIFLLIVSDGITCALFAA